MPTVVRKLVGQAAAPRAQAAGRVRVEVQGRRPAEWLALAALALSFAAVSGFTLRVPILRTILSYATPVRGTDGEVLGRAGASST